MQDPNWGFITSGATFEALVTTLVRFEDSKAALLGRRGPDGGQDARSGDGTRVFQAKYHEDASAAKAIRDAKKEVTKIAEYQQPDHARFSQWKGVTHWCLITNAAFNTTDQERWDTEVIPLFAGQGLSADYWERATINSLLVKYPEVYEARKAALQLLEALETTADADDKVLLGTTLIKFQHVRFIGVQAYITTVWALADRITGMVGQVLCTPDAGLYGKKPAKLVEHFIKPERNKTTAAALFKSVQQTFGWPIGLSYAIRNHFAHDGAQIAGSDFFKGPSAAAAFRISDDGWKLVVEKATSYGVSDSFHRVPLWPLAPQDDLRIVLKICEQEMDDALGVLLGSACNSLRGHVGFILGED